MKKFLITILMMTALCVCGGCAKEPESTQTPPPPPESSSAPKGDPEFPENEYGQDNEAVYPEVWD